MPSNGGQTCKKTSLYESAPPCPGAASDSLAFQTINALRNPFAQRGHEPSPEMWVGLRAVADTMEAMAEGKCPPAIYLSSLDPGVGKTTTVVCFLRTLLASKGHQDVAALVCVRRKDLIEAIVEEAGLDDAEFAVLTADAALNMLGCGSPRDARVLFTTHAMIEKRCEGRRFGKVGDFHFQGRGRAVRIWDEAILPGQPLTISRDNVAGLLGLFRGRHPALANGLEALFTDLKSIKNGEAICVPDLAEDHSVDLNQALELVADRPEQQAAVTGLWFLFGKFVTLRQDGVWGSYGP